MPTNNYFGNKLTSFPQQQLLNDLTTEVIKINGVDLLYLPRVLVKDDTLMGEDTLSKFDQSFEVEMYINTAEGFGGDGDMISKFGLDVKDEIILIVNKERFYIVTGLPAPREGDIIYLPMTQGMFEVKFVEDEKPFYSLGKNTVYELTCETFVYNEEIFDVTKGHAGEIFDKVERDHAITVTLSTQTDGSLTNFYDENGVILGTPLVTPTGSDVFFRGSDGKSDEDIYQGVDWANATVKAKIASSVKDKTKVFQITGGAFVAGEAIKQDVTDKATISETNPRGTVLETFSKIISENGVDDQDLDTTYSDNKEYEIEGDSILDFSETDPWSEGDL